MTPLLTRQQAADQLGIHLTTLEQHIRHHELPIIRLGVTGRTIRIHPHDLDQFIQQRTIPVRGRR